jgi:hypothetical protein
MTRGITAVSVKCGTYLSNLQLGDICHSENRGEVERSENILMKKKTGIITHANKIINVEMNYIT